MSHCYVPATGCALGVRLPDTVCGCSCDGCAENRALWKAVREADSLRVQLAEVKDELLAMTADRDSWREQADDRVDDVLRVSKEREEAYEVGRRRGQDEGEHVWRDELRAAVRERDEARVVAQRRGELLSDLQQERDELVCERDAALVRAEAAERERDLVQRAYEETNAALVKAEASDVESIAMCRRARDRAERYREALERFCTAWDKPNSSVFDVDLAYHAARDAMLEEAANECERFPPDECPELCGVAERIRALKGKP